MNDNVGIATNGVDLFYRKTDDPGYAQITMTAPASSATYTGTIPALGVVTPAPGKVDYYIRAKDGAGNESTNPSGGSGAPHVITGPNPADLLVTSIGSIPGTGVQGNSINIDFTVQNSGNLASEAFSVKAWLSTTQTPIIATADIAMTPTKSLASLAAGASASDTMTVTIPSGVQAGDSYYIIIEADSEGDVEEGSETNNTIISSTTMTIPNILYVDGIIGNDTTNLGGINDPLKSIQGAITFAGNQGGTWRINIVKTTYTVTSTIAIVSPNISLYGGYITGTNFSETSRDGTTAGNGTIITTSVSGTTVLRIGEEAQSGGANPITNPGTSILDGLTINAHVNLTNAGNQYAIQIEEGNSPTISNSKINGGQGSTTYAIHIDSSASVVTAPVIKDNDINGGIAASTSFGIDIIGSASNNSNQVIMGNTINGGTSADTSSDAYGLRLNHGCSSNSALISGNNISVPSITDDSYGIYITQKCDGIIENNTITLSGGTVSQASRRYGIYMTSGDVSPIIRYNTIKTAVDGDTANLGRSGGIFNTSSSGSPIILGNTIVAGTGLVSDNTTDSWGIMFEFHAGGVPKIMNNFIRMMYGQYTRGIDLAPSISNFSPIIVNNTIDGGTHLGGGATDRAVGIILRRAYTGNSSTPTIANNIIFTTGGAKQYGIYEDCVTDCSPKFVENNLIFNTTKLYYDNGVAVTEHTNIDAMQNLIVGIQNTGTTTAAGNVSTALALTDILTNPTAGVAAFDFHLNADIIKRRT